MPVRRLPCALAALLIAFAAGCASKATAPGTPPLRRLVTVLLTDSLGSPLPGVFVRATSLSDSAGFARLVVATTGSAGDAVFALLREGPWAFAATLDGSPSRATGGTAVIPGRTRAEGDTIVVQLAMRTGSTVTGRVWLSMAADHGGTFVNVAETGAFAETATDGSFTLAPIPPGRWTLVSYHYGYALRVTPVDIAAPGSLVELPGDSLAVVPTTDPPGGEHF